MKPYVAAVALLAGSLLTAGAALAYHPTSRSPSYEELERNEFQHIQQGQPTGHVRRGVSGNVRIFAPSRPGVDQSRQRSPSSGHGGY